MKQEPARTLIEQLRHATRASHEQLERDVDVARSAATREGYLRLLSDFHGFYRVIEPRLASVAGAERQKLPLLERDLRALGLSDEQIAALPRCEDVPALTTPGSVWGCLYVLEGSTLGGQLIARQVEQNLGMTPEDGASFFASYQQHVGTMWRSFLQLLEANNHEGERQQAAVNAAQETFAALHRWLTRGR